MKLSLFDQTRQLPSLLPAFAERPFSYVGKTLTPSRVTSLVVAPPGAVEDLTACDTAAFFDYRIFPESIVVGYGSWRSEGRKMREGDVIVQQVRVPPGPLGIRCIFAVRIVEVLRSANELAFSYGTLAGHVENGIARFALTLGPTGLIASISVRATRRIAPVHLAERIAVTPLQRWSTRRALERTRDEFLDANPSLRHRDRP